MSEPSSAPAFDQERAAAYDDRIRRLAPGYDVLHDVVASVANTLLPPDAHLLVVGAGTGTEIVTLARTQPRWRFTAVDPSAQMLDRCQETLAEHGLERRVQCVESRVEHFTTDAQFDGATSIFVSHFLQDPAARRQHFRAIAEAVRLRAPLIVADLFGDQSEPAFYRLAAAWRRSVLRAGASLDEVERIFQRVDRQISFVSEDERAECLNDAGFGAPTRFHQCLLWGGWWTRKA